jgi:hypothetical protein
VIELPIVCRCEYSHTPPQSRRTESDAMWLTALLIVAATVYRALPHPYNVAPIGALFLLSGIYVSRRGGVAWVLPFVAVILSDLIVYHQWDGSFFRLGRLVDYAALALIGLIGRWTRERGTGTRIACIVVTPVVFFLVSNFGVWAIADYGPPQLYPHTLEGLLSCYIAGIPFFRGTFIGDLLFAGGGILLIETFRRWPSSALRRLAHPATI